MDRKIIHTHLGELIISGEIHQTRNVAYIPELFGDSIPKGELHDFITCSITLPGSKNARLNPGCKGKMLTWKIYGNCVAQALKQLQKTFTIVGNSKGAMVALYAAALVPNLINRLILYKIPRFGNMRINLKNKYAGISQKIVDESTLSSFLEDIRDSTSFEIVRIIESSGWEKARKIYEGAAVSELDIRTLHSVTQPVFLLDREFYFDKLHPKEALELLSKKLAQNNVKKIHNIEEAFYS